MNHRPVEVQCRKIEAALKKERFELMPNDVWKVRQFRLLTILLLKSTYKRSVCDKIDDF